MRDLVPKETEQRILQNLEGFKEFYKNHRNKERLFKIVEMRKSGSTFRSIGEVVPNFARPHKFLHPQSVRINYYSALSRYRRYLRKKGIEI